MDTAHGGENTAWGNSKGGLKIKKIRESCPREKASLELWGEIFHWIKDSKPSLEKKMQSHLPENRKSFLTIEERRGSKGLEGGPRVGLYRGMRIRAKWGGLVSSGTEKNEK